MEITPELIFGLLITIAAWAGILYAVIKNAARTKDFVRLNEIQIRLLRKLAEKNGVSEQEIKECMQNTPITLY